ncbi:hypothetical protein N9262_02335 [Akkermansiaceae bacterium]|nr:hypothetical protein [Akkermansiaceae bacterium]
MRYEIDKKNAVRIFNDGDEAPFLFQPDWPDNTPWSSKAEATAWAKAAIEAFTNPESEFLPGESPDQPLQARVAVEPIVEISDSIEESVA